ncbi:MAG: alpha/beta hydrolase [Gemmatimonas sp.]
MLQTLAFAFLLSAAPLAAQVAQPVAVRSTGSGSETWVLLSGLVGGVAGYRALERELLSGNTRVVSIDPYHLSIDSADVSFAALAHRVNTVLDGLGITSARLVGHAHGAGVALRVAAATPERVSALYFLDAGALESNHTQVLSLSLRLAPMIAKLPGGRSFLRRKLIKGIQENSGTRDWFDKARQAEYADPTVENIGRAVALAVRLGKSQEPDSLGAVVAKLRAPVTSIVGEVPHPSGAKPVEFTALAPIGHRLTVVRLSGVGHFPHEEATSKVLDVLLGRTTSERGSGARSVPR